MTDLAWGGCRRLVTRSHHLDGLEQDPANAINEADHSAFEREAFPEIATDSLMLVRIRHMLKTGKPPRT